MPRRIQRAAKQRQGHPTEPAVTAPPDPAPAHVKFTVRGPMTVGQEGKAVKKAPAKKAIAKKAAAKKKRAR